MKLRLYFKGHIDVEVPDFDPDDDEAYVEAVGEAWEASTARAIGLEAELTDDEILYDN